MVEVYAQGNLLFFFLVRHAPKNSIFEFFKINAVGYHQCILLVKLFSKMVSKKNLKILSSTKNQEVAAFSCLRQLYYYYIIYKTLVYVSVIHVCNLHTYIHTYIHVCVYIWNRWVIFMPPVPNPRTSGKGHLFVSVRCLLLHLNSKLRSSPPQTCPPTPTFTQPRCRAWLRTAIFMILNEKTKESLTFESSPQYIVVDSMYCWAIATTPRTTVFPVGFQATQSHLMPATWVLFGDFLWAGRFTIR